jgi:hypothetical protein
MVDMLVMDAIHYVVRVYTWMGYKHLIRTCGYLSTGAMFEKSSRDDDDDDDDDDVARRRDVSVRRVRAYDGRAAVGNYRGCDSCGRGFMSSDAAYTISARAIGRGVGISGDLTLGRAIGLRFVSSSSGSKREVAAGKVSAVYWSSAPTGGVLRVRSSDGETHVFGGLSVEEARSACEYARGALGCHGGERALNVNGRNWGELAIESKACVFEVDGKMQFELDGKYISEATVVGKMISLRNVCSKRSCRSPMQILILVKPWLSLTACQWWCREAR